MTEIIAAVKNPLARLSSMGLLLGGILGAAFVIISRGEMVGAMSMLGQRWMIAHNLHFASAALLLFGVVGVYISHSHLLTLGGHFAFVLALLGTAFFFATGVLTAAVLPVIAAWSPSTVAVLGPLFKPTLPAFIVSFFVFQIGWVALGMVIADSGLLPRWAGFTTAVGAGIGMIPPRPFGNAPWMFMNVAWVIFAIGLVGLGWAGWHRDLRKADIASVASGA
jgi:hypothetical protein